jgi:hypothetical protein
MEFPQLLYRVGTAWTLESGTYDLATAKDAEQMAALLADGWHPDQYAAKAAGLNPGVAGFEPRGSEIPDDDAPPTRDELEAKARELGIKFDGRTGDKKLAALIADKLAG